MTSQCHCQNFFRPTEIPRMSIEMNTFLEYLHLDFELDKERKNVNLKMSYELIPSQHFPKLPSDSVTLIPANMLHVGQRHSSFMCTADEKLKLDFSPYHMEVTINHVQLQAYDITNGQFSPGKMSTYFLLLK